MVMPEKKKEDLKPYGDDGTYLTQLILKRDKAGIKKYNNYLREHAKELRRLEREANGDNVPGDYDGGYDD